MTASSDKIEQAAALLASARPPGAALEILPAELAPADAAEAWAVHQAFVAKSGPAVAWKVGASSPQAEIGVGEIAADTLHQSPARMPAAALRLWAVEAEIAVTLGRDLCPRETPYETEEVLAAVATWHAAIEVLDTAFAEWRGAPSLWKVADRQNHGALIVGPGTERRPEGPLGELPVRLKIDGAPAFEHRGGNNAGDPTWLLVALVNRLAKTDRWLKAGDVVTTGSATPFLQAKTGQRVAAEFDGLEAAELVVEA
ncbi:2-keto-4-pentenoate hydratase [Chenggangzhangella methanolivorans]|uniref:Fumarylacetoacetate hydrolase family protein n=1 Tax=Chenggangzhangella methanolivorans TaxID=1437009 RepID=A0A9E6UNC8_9HYPH|nr:fumarylacetoacetate hydrolase family protein [Chenggangzhangella methanolivorans]QZO00931.1 fumarylacetoacetate hydrolase family protein [Chenggangzhangella methanolivorans]